MATGSYSTKGVWQYGEDDSESTFSGLLNKLAASTSNVLPTVCTSSTRPGTPYSGQVIYETDTSRTYIYNGSAWKFVTGLAAPQKVADNTERGTLFPSPVQGNQVFNNTTKMRETYYDATGSPARSAGWYSGQDGGLVPIIPTSVTVGSGSATVTENGLVSYAGSSTISLNGVFSSAYKSYRILWNCTSVATHGDNNKAFRLRTTSDDATSIYYYAGLYQYAIAGTGSNYSGATGTTQATVGWLKAGEQYGMVTIDIMNPNEAVVKPFGYKSTGLNAASFIGMDGNGLVYSSTQFTGITVFGTGTGTTTGTVQVYGYRK